MRILLIICTLISFQHNDDNMSSIKKNVIYSCILTVSGYLFPLITFPYVTRVLGVENIGICNFVDSIVQYFIYFSMMGIGTIGIREIARAKNNEKHLSKTFCNLFVLNILSTILAILALLIGVMFVPQLQEHKSLFFIGAAKVLSNTLLIEWLFKGLENFKYITLRSIIIRSLYVVSVFVFVKTTDDYIVYFFLTSFTVVVNAIVNMIHSRNFVQYDFKGLSIKGYIKPFVIMGTYMLLTSMYTTFNVAYLGMVTDTIQVGYYSTATKLYSLIMSFYTAFTGVMMPRMSTLFDEGRTNDIKKLIQKSIEVLLIFAMPIIIITEFSTSEIIQIIAGKGYEGAIAPMRIIMPLMIVIGIEQVLVLQILTPMGQDKYILNNSVVGAIVSLGLNVILVKHLGCVGSAIVWGVSEVIILVLSYYYTRRLVGNVLSFHLIVKELLWNIPLILGLYLLLTIINNQRIYLITIIFVVLLYNFFVQVIIRKNELIIMAFSNIKSLMLGKNRGKAI